MVDSGLILDILLILGAALAGGIIARSLRLPTIVGFLVAGLAVGPGTPGPVGDVANVARAADLGVIMLMFGVGIQFSFAHLFRFRRVIMLGGSVQILATIAAGFVLGQILGLALGPSLVIGFFAANTSTVVAIKVLEGKRQTSSDYGFTATNISILQDISAVVMIIAVPSLAGDAFAYDDVLLAIPRGILLIGLAYILGVYVLPRLWHEIARAGSREISLLAGLVLAVGLSAASATLGLSIAFGAFLAGLALSENRYGYITLSDIIPLRELFASVFFVSMGMLIIPDVIWQDPLTVISLAVLVVVVKAAVSMLAVRITGLSIRVAILAGIMLAQVGEFSFVIAGTALAEGVISQDLASAFLVAAVVSILLNPGLLGMAIRLTGYESQPATSPSVTRRHVVLCGYGAPARAIIRALSGRGLPFVVVDTSPFAIDERFTDIEQHRVIFGDATQPEVLELAGVPEARVLAITSATPETASLIALRARELNPRLDIVTGGSLAEAEAVQPNVFSEVVDPTMEGSLELVRHVLLRFGVDEGEIRALQASWRSRGFR